MACAFSRIPDQTGDEAHAELGHKGDPGFGGKGRIHEVVEGRADTGRQTAGDRSKQQAAQQADDIAQMDHGLTQCRGDVNMQIGGGKNQCRQNTDQGELFCRKLLLFHNVYLLYFNSFDKGYIPRLILV